MESCSPQRLLFNLLRLPWRKGCWDKNNTIRVLSYCREYVRLSVLHVQHRRRRLIVCPGRHGQHMTPLRHELIVAASLHNVGGRSPIDLKIESQIPSKVRGAQNNKIDSAPRVRLRRSCHALRRKSSRSSDALSERCGRAVARSAKK